MGGQGQHMPQENLPGPAQQEEDGQSDGGDDHPMDIQNDIQEMRTLIQNLRNQANQQAQALHQQAIDVADARQQALQAQQAHQGQQHVFTADQLQHLLNGVHNMPPRPPPAFDPGVNMVLSTGLGTAQQVVILNEHSAILPGTVDTKGAKMPEPFDGDKSDIRPFLYRMSALFALQPVRYRLTKNRILTTCQLMMHKSTKAWAIATINAIATNTNNIYYTDNYVNFCEFILTNFGVANEKEDALHKLENLIQASLSLEQYITEFKRLQMLAEQSDEALLYKFKRGLNLRLFTAITSLENPPRDLQSWITKAREKEFLHQETDAFKKHRQGFLHGTPQQRPQQQGFRTFSHPFQQTRQQTRQHDPNAMDTSQVRQQNQRTGPRRPFQPTGPRPASKPQTSTPQQQKPAQANRPQVICHQCGRPGHIMRNCTTKINELNHNEIRQLAEWAWKLPRDTDQNDPEEEHEEEEYDDERPNEPAYDDDPSLQRDYQDGQTQPGNDQDFQ